MFAMPANLTPQYQKAEQAYRQATSVEEQLTCLQNMLKEIPKHKGTDKLQADLKHKIAKLKDESAKASKKAASKPSRTIPRQGAGRTVIVGPPNAGKSRLLSMLTRATPEVAPYPFTTREPIPGMMPWQDVVVQLIDTPAITADLFDPETQSLVRGADLVLLLLDLNNDDGLDQLIEVWNRFEASKTRLAKTTFLDEHDIGVTHTATMLVPNKTDAPEALDRWEIFRELLPFDLPTHLISAETGAGLEELRDAIYAAMDSIRVYTKHPKQKEPDRDRPFSLKLGSTLADLAELIHRDMAARLKFGKVWGTHVHDGTIVKPDYVLHEGDIVELHAD